MKESPTTAVRGLLTRVCIAVVLLTSASGSLNAANRKPAPVNKYGAPVFDGQGQHITYDRKTLEAIARAQGNLVRPKTRHRETASATPTPRPHPTPAPRPILPPTAPPWRYAVFGSCIGLSNIVIGPTPPDGAPEIIIGGNSRKSDEFAPDDFWQSIRYNPETGSYATVFVSPIYPPRLFAPVVRIARIGLAHVTRASALQIVVMLEDGRVYLYDFASKVQVGYLDINPYPANFELQALSLTDLDGDGLAELIVTNWDDLFVFNGSGQLLWQVPGAGGTDVVVGRMDNEASLKIAATNGKVVDASTHATVWNYTNGFGYRLRLAPFPGENYQQLIAAEAWDYVYSYDVGRQALRWSIPNFNTDAIEVADVDNDGIPELIIGDAQWGTVHVHDLNTQALKWEVNNPRHGVTNIAVGDVDNDGVAELFFGAGWSDTGPDYLYVADTTGAHAIKWQSIDLVGPFLGPVIGDLDGDGQPELVICSSFSDAYYGSGRILVFDLATLALRGISAPVVDNGAWTGVHDLKLRDVDGDGRMEIVIGADAYYDGAIEIYRFDSDNSFNRVWTNATRPLGSPFKFVEIADLDNDGTQKIIAANAAALTNSEGVYVYVYDYPSGVESWRSANLASYFSAADGLLVEDLNGDGQQEIVALVTGNLYTWDGPTQQLRNVLQGTNGVLLSNQATPAGFVLADAFGVGHFLQWANNSYTQSFARQLVADCVPYGYPPCMNGLNVTTDNSLWTGAGSVISKRIAPFYDDVTWRSPEFGDNFGRFVATAKRDHRNCVFSSAQHAVMCFGNCAPRAARPSPTPNPIATPRPRPTPVPRPTP